MAIVKTTIVQQITFFASGGSPNISQVEVKKLDTFDDPLDDQLPQTALHRTVYKKGDSVANEELWVQTIINSAWYG